MNAWDREKTLTIVSQEKSNIRKWHFEDQSQTLQSQDFLVKADYEMSFQHFKTSRPLEESKMIRPGSLKNQT